MGDVLLPSFVEFVIVLLESKRYGESEREIKKARKREREKKCFFIFSGENLFHLELFYMKQRERKRL